MLTSNIIAGKNSAKGNEEIHATNPTTKQSLEGAFIAATKDELQEAAEAAHEAWKSYRNIAPTEKANFLRTIADEIEVLGDPLIKRAMAESGLPEGRLKGERGRTCNQLRLFATVVEEGNWVNAIVDEALPDRKPARTDIRSMLQAIGPVAVFGASNFPLAFSTAGGDTASALASGCPVIVKAHPSHLGTNAMVASAITKAVEKCNLPKGVFSSLQDTGIEIGQALVKHPRIKAVAFTGSLKGGMGLLEAASERKEPIPVFAEMGSNNPIFLLPEKVEKQNETLANQLAGSINLGAGQFCTNPGLLILQKDKNTDSFINNLKVAFSGLLPATMLNQGIYKAYEEHKSNCLNTNTVSTEYAHSNENKEWKGFPAFASITATDFLAKSDLQEEIFGPFTLLVICKSRKEIFDVAGSLHGQLTATIMGETAELKVYEKLLEVLTEKAGRVVFNGVPTGVEVGYAMQHGGPFPATTDSRFTSVGAESILRFARPIAFQDCPDSLLPDALKANNPLGIARKIEGKWSNK